ncbi:shikimate kinase [Rhizobium etli]|nr:shikimate kinase [Rhizobium sp. IE4771]
MSPNIQPEPALLAALGTRCVVLVGMMGSGKTSVGRPLAARLGLDFVDADAEIEAAHRMTIPEIFAQHGETYFREGERRILARLLAGGPKVVATGGGAFMNSETRAHIAATGVSIWLKADFDILIRRVRRRANRPLLRSPDPEGALRKLIDDRYPTYALADVTVVSDEGSHEKVAMETVQALMSYLNVHELRAFTNNGDVQMRDWSR